MRRKNYLRQIGRPSGLPKKLATVGQGIHQNTKPCEQLLLMVRRLSKLVI